MRKCCPRLLCLCLIIFRIKNPSFLLRSQAAHDHSDNQNENIRWHLLWTLIWSPSVFYLWEFVCFPVNPLLILQLYRAALFCPRKSRLSRTKHDVCSRGGLASPLNICSCCRTPTIMKPCDCLQQSAHVWRAVLVGQIQPRFESVKCAVGSALLVPLCSLRLWIISERTSPDFPTFCVLFLFFSPLRPGGLLLEQFSRLLVILIGWTLTAHWTDLDGCCFFLFILIISAGLDLSANETTWQIKNETFRVSFVSTSTSSCI